MNAQTKPSIFSTMKSSTVAGLVLVPLGAWVALAPFLVGPWAWEWHFGRFLLALLPGGLAVLAGLVMLSGRRLLVTAGGALALAGGLWLMVGGPVYAAFASTSLGTDATGGSERVLQWMPFLLVAGALVSVLASYALGWLKPLQFGDEMWAEPEAANRRARVPLPPERPRRQRGVREPATHAAAHTRRSTQRDS